jgi:hypothetical protein
MTEEIEEEAESFVCPDCGFEATNGAGLAGHRRLTHSLPTKKDDYGKYADGVLESVKSTLGVQMEALIQRLRELDEDNAVLTRLIESVGNGVIKSSDGKMSWCQDDLKAIKRKIVPSKYTLEHLKEEDE